MTIPNRNIVGKERVQEQLFLRNTISGITLVSFSFYFFISFYKLFSNPYCIPTFYLEGYWSFFRYLFHNYLAGGSRVDYRLWGHCLRVILPLMRHVELVRCSALNAEVMYAFSESFLPFLSVRHIGPPRLPTPWPLWLISRVSRSIYSLASSGGSPSSVSLIHLVLRLFQLGWAWFDEQFGPIILRMGPVDCSFSSDSPLPTRCIFFSK